MKKFILFLVLILIIGFIFYQEGIKTFFKKPEEKISLEEEVISKEEFIPSERAQKFYISGGKILPVFIKEVIVDPFKVKEGERQVFSIWAKDTQGIERVTAKISTDKEDETIELELVEGTEVEGRWQGFWITKDISVRSSYAAVFQAINKEGKDTETTLVWQVEK
ncbi:hypothetical protein KKA72_02350 [Patescibacteria group bacterium]|nr:hypothetical protein [Patescibacteria group bacterium]MBU1877160.1 hypothetical protein [Patescibacteria group bacterium]